MTDSCLVRVYLSYKDELQINIAFFDLNGTMIQEFSSQLVLDKNIGACVTPTNKALVVPSLLDFVKPSDTPLLYISKFVEFEAAQPAPAPSDPGVETFEIEPPPILDDEDVRSEGEPDSEPILDIESNFTNKYCQVTSDMSDSWNALMQTFETVYDPETEQTTTLDFTHPQSL